tara:strand:+ start:172 stop:753 length:582 start_codon:yes stop_codon:yes gene_type:complete
MARKTLLTEGEIRQFMKLAELRPLNQGRLEEMGFGLEEQDEEEMELDVADADPMGGDDVDVALDVDAEDDVGGEMEDTGEASVEELVQALADTIADVTGVPVSVEGDLEDVDVDVEDEDVSLDDEDGMGGDEMDIELAAVEDEPGARDMYESQEEVVNEVARRVVARLAEQNEKEELATQLAERILARLTSTK